MSEKAVVLLSGGMDSATCLAVARKEGFDCHAVTFDYGQRHRHEIRAAEAIAKVLGVKEHLVVRIELEKFGGSALTDDVPVPQQPVDGIPVTYVPARNLVFLSVGTSYAEAIGAKVVFIGANQIDYSGYPDCRGDFLEAFSMAAGLGTKCGREGRRIEVRAPLLELSKAQIVKLGIDLGVDFGATHSCYAPGDDGSACGKCPACRIRAEGFRLAGLDDPAVGKC